MANNNKGPPIVAVTMDTGIAANGTHSLINATSKSMVAPVTALAGNR